MKSQDKDNPENSKPNKQFIWLINYMTLNHISDFEVDFKVNEKLDCISNINNYLEKLLKLNSINIDQIYNTNKILMDIELAPGLYRKTKDGNTDLSIDIINL